MSVSKKRTMYNVQSTGSSRLHIVQSTVVGEDEYIFFIFQFSFYGREASSRWRSV